MIQHNAAKFVTNSYPRKGHYDEFSISKILNDLQWTTLEQRRNQSKVTMVYKILNGHVIIPPESLPRVPVSTTTRKCNEVKVGASNQLVVRKSRGLITPSETFFFSAPSLWNNIVTPAQAVAPSIDAFKDHFTR